MYGVPTTSYNADKLWQRAAAVVIRNLGAYLDISSYHLAARVESEHIL